MDRRVRKIDLLWDQRLRLPSRCLRDFSPSCHGSFDKVLYPTSSYRAVRRTEIDVNFKEMEDWKSARGFCIYRLENAVRSGQGTAQKQTGKVTYQRMSYLSSDVIRLAVTCYFIILRI
jgi:hypothetical protein